MTRFLFLILLGAVAIGLFSTLATASKSGVEPQVISLPKGPGSIEGLGESFEPQLNTGTATYSVKIKVSPGINKHQPEVALDYNSGYGNSPVGVGWSLAMDYIQRRTDKGVPNYNDADTFSYASGGELVPVGSGIYRLKIEGQFMRFQKSGDTWEAWRKNGTHLYFGSSAATRQNTPFGTFRWLLERSVDTNGNEIRYYYTTDGGQVYLSEIRYSIMPTSLYKSVQFHYEDRADIVTDYHSRSLVKTAKRLKSVDVLSSSSLVRRYELAYKAGADFSLLSRVTQFGVDGTTSLPPLTFDYSQYVPSNIRTVTMVNPPPYGVSLLNGNVDLIDINADSLPDIVHTWPMDGRHYFYINQGKGEYAAGPVVPDAAPQYFLSAKGVMMADMDGDGKADLFVKTSSTFGYFKNKGNLKWEEEDWVPCTPQPNVNFESQNVRLLDVNNDGLIDIIVDDGYRYNLWLNHKDNQWSDTYDLQTERILNFSSVNTKMGDMNGDRMEDLVQVLKGYVSYFPNRGNGEFDAEVVMAKPPLDIDPAKANLVVADINNDGLADIALIGNTSMTVWFNGGSDTFKDPVQFDGLPSFIQGTSAFRFADMNGDGFRDLLINNENAVDRYQYVDFNNGVQPNILTKISNGLGMETMIEYKSSTDYAVADREAGNPWQTRIPFPVPVVSRVTVKDLNGGPEGEYVTDYAYRDGYYDGAEKQFRGFAEVDKVTSGEAGAPPLKSHYSFDVGRDEESSKGMVKTLAALEQNGTLAPPVGLFDREDNDIVTRQLLTGTNGEKVRFSFTSAKTRSVYEKTLFPIVTRREFDQDSYGNTIQDFNYGIVAGVDKAVGKDEVLTTTDYCLDEANWILDRPCEIRKTTLTGGFVSHQKNYYDGKGNLIRQEGTPDGATFIPLVRNVFDSYGNIIRITDANDHFRDVAYDDTFQTFPVSEAIGGLGLSLSASYDVGLGVIIAYTDFNGNVTGYGYDPLARLTSIVKPGDSAALPTQEFVYTLANPVSSVLTKSREQAGLSGTYDAVTYYDGLGRKLQTRSEGTANRWVVSDAVTFNKQKGIKQKWLPYFNSGMDYANPAAVQPFVLMAYDAKGRSIQETNPDGSMRTTLYQPLRKAEYDEEDNAPAGTHAGTPHTFINDGLDRLVQVLENNGGILYTTGYGYDGLDNLIKITDNEGNIKTMAFDGLGRKTWMNDPDRHEMTYSYDPVGNLLSTTDARKQSVSYTYDAANRIVTESFNSVKVRYHYDGDLSPQHPVMANTRGKLAWVEDEAGREYYSYDKRGNTVVKVREIAGRSFANTMAYDSLDRLSAFIYPDGYTVTYQYNAMNQLDSLPGLVTAIDYEPDGKKARFVYANGIESTYTYDSRRRMTHLKSVAGIKTYQDLTYAYDGVSNITAVADGRPAKTTEDQSRTYRYDDLYRLTQATATDWTESYQYSSIGNMTFKTDVGAMTYGENGAGPHALTKAAGANLTYAYDMNGNIASKQPGFTYQFDHKDRLAGAVRAADGGQIAYTYDFGGNRVGKSVTVGANTSSTIYADKYTEVRGDKLIKQVFAGNRLVARLIPDNSNFVSRPIPLTIADFDKNKDGSVSVTEIRQQGTDPNKMEGPDVADALRIYYANMETNPTIISFGTMAAALHEYNDTADKAQSFYYYLPDHLGSANLVTDSTGAVVEESVFYPYGKDRAKTGTFTSNYRFTGKELDDETGLHYFGARYYDSQTGRFVSTDPMLLVDNSDRDKLIAYIENGNCLDIYRYTKGNPISMYDPNGLEVSYKEGVDEVNDKMQKKLEGLSEYSGYDVKVVGGWENRSEAGGNLANKSSQHNTGNAADIHLIDKKTGEKLDPKKAAYIVAGYGKFTGVGYYDGTKVGGHSPHVHVDLRGTPARWSETKNETVLNSQGYAFNGNSKFWNEYESSINNTTKSEIAKSESTHEIRTILTPGTTHWAPRF